MENVTIVPDFIKRKINNVLEVNANARMENVVNLKQSKKKTC